MTEVRPADAEEAEDIFELHKASIRAFGPQAYRPAQIRAWAATADPEYPITNEDHRFVVFERNGMLGGFSDLHLTEPEITAM